MSIVGAERDLLWAMLQRLARRMYLMEQPQTGGGASSYTAMVQLEARDYNKLRELQEMQAFTDAGLNAMPRPTKDE